MRLLLATTTIVLALSACSSAAQRYRVKSDLCVAENDTRETIDACRAKVREEFHITPSPSATRDAGAR
jgi:hypothetical protein